MSRLHPIALAFLSLAVLPCRGLDTSLSAGFAGTTKGNLFHIVFQIPMLPTLFVGARSSSHPSPFWFCTQQMETYLQSRQRQRPCRLLASTSTWTAHRLLNRLRWKFTSTPVSTLALQVSTFHTQKSFRTMLPARERETLRNYQI